MAVTCCNCEETIDVTNYIRVCADCEGFCCCLRCVVNHDCKGN